VTLTPRPRSRLAQAAATEQGAAEWPSIGIVVDFRLHLVRGEFPASTRRHSLCPRQRCVQLWPRAGATRRHVWYS
jgi:hypothetical protein